MESNEFRKNLPRYSGEYLEENAGAADVTLTADNLINIEELITKYPNIGPRYSSRENKFVKK